MTGLVPRPALNSVAFTVPLPFTGEYNTVDHGGHRGETGADSDVDATDPVPETNAEDRRWSRPRPSLVGLAEEGEGRVRTHHVRRRSRRDQSDPSVAR